MASLSHLPALDTLRAVVRCNWYVAMTKTGSEEHSEKFTEQWHRCRDWLLPFMQNNQPKFLTKDELRSVAMHELKVCEHSTA